MALLRIGARGSIASLQDDSPNAIKVNTVWDMIFQEVLSERDWKFAKIRAELQEAGKGSFTASISGNTLTVTAIAYGPLKVGQAICGTGILPGTVITALGTGTGQTGTYTVSISQTVPSESMTTAMRPLYAYRHAYALPSDFLRLVKPREVPQERSIAYFNDVGLYPFFGHGCWRDRDVPVWPREVAPYVVETLSDGNKYLLSNYPDWGEVHIPVKINYIRLITDLTQLMPGFVNCLAYRLAGELALPITEDKQKAEGMMQAFRDALNSAQAQLECDDFLKDEQGSQSWVEAGRCPCPGWGWLR
jgi:hypothetical protein